MTDSGSEKSSSTKPAEKPHFTEKLPKFEEPGLKKVKTTNVFRAVNFELYVKPNLFVMAVGVLSMSVCVGYIAYMNATIDSRKATYTTMNEEGEFIRREKKSKWD